MSQSINEGVDDALQSRAKPTDSVGSSTTTTNNTLSDDRRRKWSTEELKELMFCYFKARSEGPVYIGRLQALFTERNPNNTKINKFNGNTLSNETRRIIKQNVISQELLVQIQKQANTRDQHIQITQQTQSPNTTHLSITPNTSHTPETSAVKHTTDKKRGRRRRRVATRTRYTTDAH
ncbi:unnamed protein product [Chilo suppressalis]|uniref:Uncharacterized protein n=1 Tax=Chilo suppressalis TaxID=168631 RepID=A0ABN8B012_CHISP|nr:unnamed protein product [Chilo suppressalis]